MGNLLRAPKLTARSNKIHLAVDYGTAAILPSLSTCPDLSTFLPAGLDAAPIRGTLSATRQPGRP